LLRNNQDALLPLQPAHLRSLWGNLLAIPLYKKQREDLFSLNSYSITGFNRF
jgi:hypothetical protein